METRKIFTFNADKVYWGLICVLFLMLSCKTATDNKVTNAENATINMPVFSQSQLGTTLAQVDKAEVTFYGNVPLTINVDQHGARAFMKNLKFNGVEDLNCAKPLGRIFYYGNGESIIDVEFCMSDMCDYYIFYKDGQTYANYIPKENTTLFQSMINSRIGSSPQ